MNPRKLLARLTNSQTNVRFADLVRVVEALGFRRDRVARSHQVFIRRKRSKAGVPSQHKLWSVTVDLLKRLRVKGRAPTDRFFLTDEGQPLGRAEFIDGKMKKTDAIKNAFWRVQNETKINGGRGFYTLRKTAATEIERIDPLVTSMFLAHSPKEMKRHYALRNWDALHAAIEEMGRRLDLGSWLTTPAGQAK